MSGHAEEALSDPLTIATVLLGKVLDFLDLVYYRVNVVPEFVALHSNLGGLLCVF